MKNTFTKIALMLFITASAFTATAQSSKDAKFAKCAAQDGLMKVKLAELALDKSKSADIKRHAQHMLDDHGQANKELKALAAKKNMTLPASLTEKQQKCYDKMAQIEPAKFDRKYANQMKCDHRKAISLFKKQAKKGEDAELTSWASAKVPTLEHHLDMWEAASKNLKDKDSKSVSSK